MRNENLKEQVKKAFCYQKLFWPFSVWINCSTDLKNFANSPRISKVLQCRKKYIEKIREIITSQIQKEWNSEVT